MQAEYGMASAAALNDDRDAEGRVGAVRGRRRVVVCDPPPRALERVRSLPARRPPRLFRVVRGGAQPLPRGSRPRPAVAGYADEILVTARTVRLGHTSFDMEYALWRDGLCALGRAVLILVVNATGEKTALPLDLRENILARDPAAKT